MNQTKKITRFHNRTPNQDAVVAAIKLAKAILQENSQYGTQKRFAPFARRILAGQAGV